MVPTRGVWKESGNRAIWKHELRIQRTPERSKTLGLFFFLLLRKTGEYQNHWLLSERQQKSTAFPNDLKAFRIFAAYS